LHSRSPGSRRPARSMTREASGTDSIRAGSPSRSRSPARGTRIPSGWRSSTSPGRPGKGRRRASSHTAGSRPAPNRRRPPARPRGSRASSTYTEAGRRRRSSGWSTGAGAGTRAW